MRTPKSCFLMILWAFEDIMASPSLGGVGEGMEKRRERGDCLLLTGAEDAVPPGIQRSLITHRRLVVGPLRMPSLL